MRRTFANLVEMTGGELDFVDELVDTYLDDGESQLAAMRAAAASRRRREPDAGRPLAEVGQPERRGAGARRAVPDARGAGPAGTLTGADDQVAAIASGLRATPGVSSSRSGSAGRRPERSPTGRGAASRESGPRATSQAFRCRWRHRSTRSRSLLKRRRDRPSRPETTPRPCSRPHPRAGSRGRGRRTSRPPERAPASPCPSRTAGTGSASRRAPTPAMPAARPSSSAPAARSPRLVAIVRTWTRRWSSVPPGSRPTTLYARRSPVGRPARRRLRSRCESEGAVAVQPELADVRPVGVRSG